MDRMNGRQERSRGDKPIEPFNDLKMPPDPRAADGSETMADFGPEIVQRIGDLRESLGLPREQGFLDDSLAPPVDMGLVRAYVDGTLEGQQSAEVLELSIKYRSWDREVERLLIEKIRAEQGGRATEDL